jgi:hypothetical protein
LAGFLKLFFSFLASKSISMALTPLQAAVLLNAVELKGTL